MTTKFVYAYKLIAQESLIPNMPDQVVHEYIGDGHIEIDGINLCEIKPPEGSEGVDHFTTRLKGIPICKACQKRWKNMRGSPWKDWINGWPKRV